MPSKQMQDIDRIMIPNLKANSGKTLAQWLGVVKKSDLKKHSEIVKLLKSTYDVGHGYADLVARHALGGAATAPSDLVDAQYDGPKSHLRDIFENAVKAVRQFGSDVEVSPKKTYVSLRRNRQFAIIQASTKDRVDIGLVLKGKASTKRLEYAGSFNTMMTHRVRVTVTKEVDQQLISWLREAYESA